MNELYIPGDLVMINGRNIVYEISSVELRPHVNNFIYTLVPISIGTVMSDLSIDSICPIPLTKFILEENGWRLHKRDSHNDVSWSSYYKPEETNLSLRFYQEEKVFALSLYEQVISVTPIRYIHQLQHLLFGLGINHEMKV